MWALFLFKYGDNNLPMTTLKTKRAECFVCGTHNRYSEVASTSTYGYPDLDTRPQRPSRYNLKYEVHRCRSCGYCSEDLSKGDSRTKELVNSQAYQAIVDNEEIPIFAASYLALSYEKEQKNDFLDSAWDVIKAAWLCDDRPDHDVAKQCREKAISLIAKATAIGQHRVKFVYLTEMVTVDLMRRTSQFELAINLLEELKLKVEDKNHKQIIEYQLYLISNKDTDSHSYGNAFKNYRVVGV